MCVGVCGGGCVVWVCVGVGVWVCGVGVCRCVYRCVGVGV